MPHVLYQLDAARRRKLAGMADYFLGKIGSHRTSISETDICHTETRGNPRPEETTAGINLSSCLCTI